VQRGSDKRGVSGRSLGPDCPETRGFALSIFHFSASYTCSDFPPIPTLLRISAILVVFGTDRLEIRKFQGEDIYYKKALSDHHITCQIESPVVPQNSAIMLLLIIVISGNIGSKLLDALIRRGHSVRGLGRDP
jgi:hypothetical protein